MPELPEVETVRRGLAPIFETRRLARVEQRRADLRRPFPADFAARLTGRRINALRRRAKYMLWDLDDGWSLIVHLGMSGRMMLADHWPQHPGPHDHVIFAADDGRTATFSDPRRFGLMDLVETARLDSHPLFAGLGPEPLGNEFSGPALFARMKGRKSPLKAVLLDQKTVAGLGNIYVSEALFLAGLNPTRLAAEVTAQDAERLAKAVRDVLERAIAAGGSTLRDYVQADGELGYFQHDFAVYDREGAPCPGCDCDTAATGGVRRIVQSGRSTFYCPNRQP
ncbi:MAG TPA: bifunctional DNA-formamidopyrimidine glycosylase/DNA-(apurinic or apyrimidinic site) lyase [Azospirillaceae bacterium]|nr:bifunctional DNA-formamidopyrimidine glycosylase/DNA-(apurinic or apyrimidinic site) lyase [Azospirillaceae bacterium]HRQ79962.1 bifunctional DNA-formamidopyrimidine glycosylase/DNA-(apurinic or apyrimidinic site) lyase [Azospirillaceae bacterium]